MDPREVGEADMSKTDRLKELVEQTGNAMAAGLIDDIGDPELAEMTEIIHDLLERDAVDSVKERDRMTIERLKLAAAAVESALKAMPNNKSSVFSRVDAGRLYQIQQEINVLLLAEQEISGG